jgi:hypothetical protein
MLKFIGKALAGMVLTKEARAAAGDLAQTARNNAKSKPSAALDSKQQAIAEIHSQAASLITPNRAELIRQAMEVRAAKQALLADLNDEDRAKLVATALRAFLNESDPKA